MYVMKRTGEKRTGRVEIRLTQEQKETLQRTADYYGLGVSEYLRVLAVTHLLSVTERVPSIPDEQSDDS